MAKGGKYLRKAPVKKKGKALPIILIVLAVLLVGIIGCGVWYYNYLINLVSRPGSVEMPTMSDDELAAMLGTVPTAPLVNPEETEEETTAPSTSPEDTWPEIVSDTNITNIMLVGQAARADESYRLADSMILCSINRETNTLTMTSFLRDMRVTVPAYAGHGAGFSRMNVCYHLGSYYTGEEIDSMKMLALAVEQNFGVKVDHTVEVDFEIFKKVIDLLGGVDVELTKEEAYHLTYEKNGIGEFVEGPVTLTGHQALAYARIRKIDNDFKRTNRQRTVITSLLNKMRTMNIMDINDLFTQVVPMIKTDMTNSEITNYAFEFIPMLADLNIVSQSIPFDGTYWYKNIGSEERPDYVIDANLSVNAKRLQESIGMIQPTE